MKTLFLFRDGQDAKYLLSQLNSVGLVSYVILEKGTKAKIAKLKRMFNVPWWMFPQKALDLMFIMMYSTVMERGMRSLLPRQQLPMPSVELVVDDANDSECIEKINHLHPDIIFIYGTAILKRNFLKSVHVPLLNLHTGIVPKYRNVHSDFWAYIKGEPEQIGVTVMHLSEGIDSGDIALQDRITYKKGDDLVALKVKNLNLIVELVKKTVLLLKKKKLIKEKQLHSDAVLFPTPGWTDVIRFFFHFHQLPHKVGL